MTHVVHTPYQVVLEVVRVLEWFGPAMLEMPSLRLNALSFEQSLARLY